MRFAPGVLARRLLLAFLLGSPGLGALGAAPAAAETLKVGANVGNLPWEFQDSSGETVGFEIDLMKEVAKRLGDDVSFINIPFTGLFAAVQSGQIDAAVSSITITPKRLASVSFAQPYYDSDQSWHACGQTMTAMAKSRRTKARCGVASAGRTAPTCPSASIATASIPANTRRAMASAEIVAVLRGAAAAALAEPAVRERVEATGSVVATGDDTTPAGFAALLRRETELSRRAAEVVGLAQR